MLVKVVEYKDDYDSVLRKEFPVGMESEIEKFIEEKKKEGTFINVSYDLI